MIAMILTVMRILLAERFEFTPVRACQAKPWRRLVIRGPRLDHGLAGWRYGFKLGQSFLAIFRDHVAHYIRSEPETDFAQICLPGTGVAKPAIVNIARRTILQPI